MKRLLYALPLFALLLPWTFIGFTIVGVSIFATPYSAFLILPVVVVLGGAFAAHRSLARRERHGAAFVATASILAAPLLAILVSFGIHGDRVLKQSNVDDDVLASLGYSHVDSKGACRH